MRFNLLAFAVLSLLFTLGLQTLSLGAPPQQRPGPLPTQPPTGTEEDQNRAKMEKEMAKKANQERQAELKRDTDKLLKLATELKEYVDKTNENVLSLEVLKKAEEIEKLAHSVKGKMKGAN